MWLSQFQQLPTLDEINDLYQASPPWSDPDFLLPTQSIAPDPSGQLNCIRKQSRDVLLRTDSR